MRILNKNHWLACTLAMSLLTTSIGGAVATTAYAAEATKPESKQLTNNQLLIGLGVIGLAVALSGGDSDKDAKAPVNPPQTGGQTPNTGSTVLSNQTKQAITLLNNDRAKYDLPALKANSQLTKLAETYAQDMIARGFFAHNNPEGQTPFDRMQKAGISYRTAGENLAINNSIDAAQRAFMNSSGHRANILNKNFTEVGIGVVQHPNGQLYVVQEFIGK